MKKLTVILSEEDFRHIAGALLKTNADFQVETIKDEEPKPVRTLQRTDESGRTCFQVVEEQLATMDSGTRFTTAEFQALLRHSGFHKSTIGNQLSRSGNVTKLHQSNWRIK